ncbi:MAG: hypothetical protein JST92_06525 [Deltaproteobacteria bacterium]|nr:hypothetical protein [Deltaproteobacteria bacterium]
MRTLIRFICRPGEIGLFVAAHHAFDHGTMPASLRDELAALIQWFNTHLPEPKRLVHTKSKGFYRRDTVAISWFKDDAKDFIAQAWRLVRVVERLGYEVELIRTTRPGYVTHEDDFQVAAIPFADERD